MKLEQNVSLLPYNTFHVDCKARYFINIESFQDFLDLFKTPERKQLEKKLFIGAGSNMLLVNERYDGLVVHNGMTGKEIIAENEWEIFLKVWWGENRNDFVRRTIDQGLYGIENLVSIPGNVAAAPIQNIGAYGMDVQHAIVNVGGMDLRSGTYETISHKDCMFAYRDSIFKHDLKDDFFITDVTFRLQHYNADTYSPYAQYGNVSQELESKWITKPSPHDLATAITSIRASKLPDRTKVWTAGSFFKNAVLSKSEYEIFLQKLKLIKPDLMPETYDLGNDFIKIPTGRILDQVLGYRGHREGNVGCREHQALCLVNYGGATWQEIVRFSRKLQKECREKLWIDIEPEVNFIQ